MNLYKDAEKLIEDFFDNFELRIGPKSGCDEVAVQRVKETLAKYLEFTAYEDETIGGSELESVFRAALTDFLYEVYFTLEDPAPEEGAANDGGDFDETWSESDAELEEFEDDDALEGGFYEILSLEELCGLLRDDPEGHVDCDCLTEKALEACAAQNPRQVAESLEDLAEQLRTRPRNASLRRVLASVYLALGEVQVRIGDAARAIASFRQAARTHGRLPLAYARIAGTHLVRGELDLAIAAWREQIRIAPDDPEPYFSCASAFERQARPEQAMEMLHAMLRVDGDNALALDMLIRLSQEVGKVPEAQSYRDRILGLRPPRRVEDIAVWVKYHLEERHFEGILEHLHKEELDSPSQSVLNLLKALVFLAKDDPDNVEVELLLLRDKLDGRAADLDEVLGDLERLFGAPRIDRLRRAISEHVIGA